jgi:hypothetical protein
LALTAAGVRSINLAGTSVTAETQLGEVAVINKGSYTRTNGTTQEFVDAALTYFSSATNLPVLTVQNENFGKKANKYQITISGGAMTLGLKKAKGYADPRAGALGAATMLNFKGKSIGMLSPIILDLDGDGIEMKSIKKSKAMFDMNGDGSRDDTGWVGKGDGFLVIDRNNDGLITSASELSFAAEDPKARSDLEALAALDSNNDRVINNDDARFKELKVWVDANANGVTDAGELKTLEAVGITEIGLAGRAVDGTAKIGDNVLISTATFKRSNGGTGTLGNVALAFRPSVAVASAAATQGPDLNSALAALRLGNNMQPSFANLDYGDLLQNNIFDYFETGTGEQAKSSGDVSPAAVSEVSIAAQVSIDASGSMATDRILALITQDMASFGKRVGESEITWRNGGHKMMTDFFA